MCPGARAGVVLWAVSGWLAVAPALAGSSLAPDNPTYQAVRVVYDNLVRAIGDGRTAPTLEVVPRDAGGHLQVAWFDPYHHSVAIEERICDLCTGLGPRSADALAVLLGHELAHCYHDHGWVGDFGNGFADLAVGQAVLALAQTDAGVVELEAEADYFGGLYGYVAGYNTLGVAPEVLERVYRECQLSGDLGGYPSLEERQAIARRAEARLRHLVPVFGAAHDLLLVQECGLAARCFDYLARQFPSREIHSNAGVARVLQALRLFDAGQVRFAYPLELDAQTRLLVGSGQGRSGLAPAEALRRQQLLGEAQACFAESHRRDPAYATALTNLACVCDLRGQPEDALYWARKACAVARASGDSAVLAHALVARGIAQARGAPPDSAAARADFEAAQGGGDPLARLDLAVLGGGAPAQDRGAGARRVGPRERTTGPGSQEWKQLSLAPTDTVCLPDDGEGRPAVVIATRQFDTGDALVVDTGGTTISFMATRPNLVGATARGVRVGDTGAHVDSTYGRPSRLVAARDGSHRVYDDARIILHSDGSDRICGWTVFSIDEALR